MFLIAPHRYWMLCANIRDRHAHAQESWRTCPGHTARKLRLQPQGRAPELWSLQGAATCDFRGKGGRGSAVLKSLCTRGALKGLLLNRSGRVSCGMTGRGLGGGLYPQMVTW